MQPSSENIPFGQRSPEERYREALRPLAIERMPNDRKAIPEFFIPRWGARADLVIVGDRLDAYEIKTRRDNLRRLPLQVRAYSTVFDRCTLVAAERHLQAALPVLPEWWGAISVLTPVEFRILREPEDNPSVTLQILGEMMWRQELLSALQEAVGGPRSRRGTVDMLAKELRNAVGGEEFAALVRKALIERDPAKAMWQTRRYVMDTSV